MRRLEKAARHVNPKTAAEFTDRKVGAAALLSFPLLCSFAQKIWLPEFAPIFEYFYA
jgi:hypothetical protein